jgi:hypothetical protein
MTLVHENKKELGIPSIISSRAGGIIAVSWIRRMTDKFGSE